MSVRGAADPQRRRCGGRGRWRRGAAALGGPPRPHPHPAPLPPGSAVPPPGGRRHCTAPVRPAPRGDAPTPRRCRSPSLLCSPPPASPATLMPLPRSESHPALAALPVMFRWIRDPPGAQWRWGKPCRRADPRSAAADLGSLSEGAALPGAAARCRRPPRDGSGGGGGERRAGGEGMGTEKGWEGNGGGFGRGGAGHGARSEMGIGAGIG